LAVDKGKEDKPKQKNLTGMGRGSISQRTTDLIDVTLVDTVVVRKRMAAILELLSTSGYVV